MPPVHLRPLRRLFYGIIDVRQASANWLFGSTALKKHLGLASISAWQASAPGKHWRPASGCFWQASAPALICSYAHLFLCGRLVCRNPCRNLSRNHCRRISSRGCASRLPLYRGRAEACALPRRAGREPHPRGYIPHQILPLPYQRQLNPRHLSVHR